MANDLTPRSRGDTDCRAYCDEYEVPGDGLTSRSSTHGLALVYELAPLTDNEEAHLLPGLDALHGLGFTVEHVIIDGGYTSVRNFASLAVDRIQTTCKITQDWVVHAEATTGKLQERYQRSCQHPEFEAGAPMGNIERFLHPRGEHALVGKHERNRVMAGAEDAPEAYREVYGQHNKSENLNNQIKHDRS